MAQGYIHLHLLDKLSQRKMHVLTTHLKAKTGPANEAAREAQVQQLLAHLEESLGGAGGGGSLKAAAAAAAAAAEGVIVCGDFNTEPGTAACQAVAQHPLGLTSLWDVPLAGPLAGPPAAAGAAAAPAAQAAGDEFTTWKIRSGSAGAVECKRTIDYIWCAGPLRPASRWAMLRAEEIGPGALPCPAYPSDHVAQCCELEWRR
jgi:endonuclease/exonuclease/phosphatase family metal-dependent hydrolase